MEEVKIKKLKKKQPAACHQQHPSSAPLTRAEKTHSENTATLRFALCSSGAFAQQIYAELGSLASCTYNYPVQTAAAPGRKGEKKIDARVLAAADVCDARQRVRAPRLKSGA